eukprot:gene4668-5716_t
MAANGNGNLYENANSRVRYEAYTKLQAAATAFGEDLPIPEIVAIGGQSDGKSSLMEALLGFRFNVREVEMGTRRPLMVQMVHDETAVQPRVRLQAEDSDEYSAPIMPESAICEAIRDRTESHLREVGTSVSSKPIVMKAEFAYCPNLTIIDTPGFIMKSRKGESESTPQDILNMVKDLAAPPNRIILFLQQSSVEWCSSMWLHVVQEVDPSLSRTLLVASKFDNRLKEFSSRWEVDRYLSASGYLPHGTRPFFVALPKERGNTGGSEEFRQQVQATDENVLSTLRENVEGGFDEAAYGDREELARRYREAAPGISSILEERSQGLSAALSTLDERISTVGNVAHQRRDAMRWTSAITSHINAILSGSGEPDPMTYGLTTDEERSKSGFGVWPGVPGGCASPAHAELRLHGGAAFERVIQEFQTAAWSLEFPAASRDKVANVLLSRQGMMTMGNGSQEVADGIARSAVQACMGPLLEMACDRLAFVLRRLYELSLVKDRLEDGMANGTDGANVNVPASLQSGLRRAHDNFVLEQCANVKKLVRHHLMNATSTYAYIPPGTPQRGETRNPNTQWMDLGDEQQNLRQKPTRVPDGVQRAPLQPAENALNKPGTHVQREEPKQTPEYGLPHSQGVVEETPSPQQGSEEAAVRRTMFNAAAGRQTPNAGVERPTKQPRHSAFHATRQEGGAYGEVCIGAASLFDRICRHLSQDLVPTALRAGFLTPCAAELSTAISVQLFACNDQDFMCKFSTAGSLEAMQAERVDLAMRHERLSKCKSDFDM